MKHLTPEMIAIVLSKSRTDNNKSQKYMAEQLDKSIGTIKNWESGYATPNLIDTLKWFDVLGINPLTYMLDFLYPNNYSKITETTSDDEVNNSIRNYLANVAPMDEKKRKIAYCIYGNTGSDWHAQVDMICAYNHLDLRSKVNIAQTILDSYEMDNIRKELIHTDQVLPDIDNLRKAIKAGKEAASYHKGGYISE